MVNTGSNTANPAGNPKILNTGHVPVWNPQPCSGNPWARQARYQPPTQSVVGRVVSIKEQGLKPI